MLTQSFKSGIKSNSPKSIDSLKPGKSMSCLSFFNLLRNTTWVYQIIGPATVFQAVSGTHNILGICGIGVVWRPDFSLQRRSVGSPPGLLPVPLSFDQL